MPKQNFLIGKCRLCDYEVQIPITESQLKRYQSGEMIQNVLPHVSPDDREVLISQTCGKCFDKMFA